MVTQLAKISYLHTVIISETSNLIGLYVITVYIH